MAARINKGGPSNAEKIARRDEACEEIRKLLVGGSMAMADIAEHLHLNTGTTYGYLTFLAEIGEVHRVPDGGRRSVWALGREDRDDDSAAPRHGAVVVPAQQVGMHRHWMDIALFGPARETAV